MSKYAEGQITAMAAFVVEADRLGDERALQLYITMSAITGLAPLVVRDLIKGLSNEQ